MDIARACGHPVTQRAPNAPKRMICNQESNKSFSFYMQHARAKKIDTMRLTITRGYFTGTHVFKYCNCEQFRCILTVGGAIIVRDWRSLHVIRLKALDRKVLVRRFE